MMHYTYTLIDPRTETVFYVGKGWGRRLNRHFHESIKGTHPNRHVQNKIMLLVRLGLLPIAEKIFEHEDEWPCHAVEVAAIAFYGRGNLCNLTDGGEGTFNPSPETRRLMSLRERSPEERLKIALAVTGPKNGNFGIPKSDAIKAKMRSVKLGKKHSDESRKKISLSKLAACIKRPHTEATKEKMRLAALGRPVHKPTEETRAKLSAARMGSKNHNFGKPMSDETKRKISLSKKLRCLEESL